MQELIANPDVKSQENTSKNLRKTQRNSKLLKNKRILIPTYKLSGGPVL